MCIGVCVCALSSPKKVLNSCRRDKTIVSLCDNMKSDIEFCCQLILSADTCLSLNWWNREPLQIMFCFVLFCFCFCKYWFPDNPIQFVQFQCPSQIKWHSQILMGEYWFVHYILYYLYFICQSSIAKNIVHII